MKEIARVFLLLTLLTMFIGCHEKTPVSKSQQMNVGEAKSKVNTVSGEINGIKNSRKTTQRLEDPFSQYNNLKIKKMKVSGEEILHLKGDVVYPRFSPNGRYLAYSKVIVENKIENTEVLVYDLKKKKEIVLLDPQSAKDYATYKAYVLHIQWLNNRHLKVNVSDGDVDSTDITFDVLQRKIIRQKFIGLDDIISLPKKHQKFRDKALELSVFQLLGDATYADLSVKYQTSKVVFFLIKMSPSYEKGNNLMYLFKNKEFTRITNFNHLFDFDVNSKGNQIAFCYWEKDERHIRIQNLKLK